jgi:carbamoyltransferase
MLATGKGNKLEILDSIDFPHSIGIFYSAFTQFLGFPHYGDEYKVMGLAPYGKPIYIDKLRDVVKLTPDGLFRLNLKYFNVTSGNIISYGKDHIPVVNTLYSQKLVEQFGKPRKNEDLTHYHKDLAASVQAYTEEIIFHLMKTLHKRTGLLNLCLAGGVAQNSVANGKITRNTPFKAVYIPSAGHDAGISMGAALYVQHMILGHSRNPSIRSAYTGSRYSNNEIEELLKQEGIEYALYDDDNELFEKIADRLINSGVIGWFNGRAEFGPRALGGRSILADPRRKDAKDLLNAKVKRRESFRPFAPSILKEYVDEYFEVVDEVPFMEKVFPIKKEKQELIPAVNHVDGTGRLQTVDRDINPRYYNLINRFYQKTGVPILLNTSFNENEPIVNSPKEALDCFLRTQMDMLVLENIIVERKNGLK